ncbi:MAG: hypothetical protein IT462_12255 [Planctomycetes bacterium]|nr:hypothetical protein [Planctomycetota bacterium]
MTLLILKACRWLYRTLNSDARPWQIGLAVVLGALAGLLPLGLGTVAAFLLILLVNVHFSTAFFSFAVFQLLSLTLQTALIRPIGERTLDLAPQALVVGAARTPIVSLFRFDYFDVAGGIALWLIIAAPLMAGVTLFYARYQAWMKAKLANSRIMKLLSQTWLFKGLRFVFIGHG